MKSVDSQKRERMKFSFLRILSQGGAGISVIVLVAIVLYILINGMGSLNSDLLFGEYGDTPSILPAFVGTIELVVIALAIACPLGIFTAIFLVEWTKPQNKLVKAIRVAIETLAGIPSIVYGLFGYLVFVVAFGMGYSILGGGITLSIMILPVIVRSTEESLFSVPNSLREGSLSLGASKVRTIFKVVLPCASGGIVSAIILAIGRVVSESAVLIMTIGMVVNKVPQTVLSPGTSLALDIYFFSSHGHPSAAAATSVVLLIFVLILNISATLIGKALKKKFN